MKELAMLSNAPSKPSGGRPLIQEVSETVNAELPVAVHTQRVHETEDGAKQLVVTVECPHAAVVGEIDLQVSATEIAVDAEGQLPLRLPLQHKVDADSIAAKYNKRKRILTLTIPIL
mmetsp:Transcript_7824/g.11529  ORF Transcript_7824/g.11529 Transcript_7824/m.11529 type:complete len:117 (+) Transcript_7824:66-416(+)